MDSLMNVDILLSVVIPIHGRQDMLSGLLESIPDDPRIEVIIADDQSDPAIDLPSDVGRRRVHLVRLSGEERYAGTARNRGLAVSSGRFVMFFDSDDLVNGTGLLGVLGQLREEHDVFYVLGDSFRDDGRPGGRHITPNFLIRRFANTGDHRPLIELHQPMFKIYRKAFITEAGAYFDATRHANDVMFNARCHVAGPRCKFIDVVVPLVREGNPSLTSVVDREGIEVRLVVQEKYNSFLRKNGLQRYQIPVVNQAKKIVRIDPVGAARWCIRAAVNRQPVLFTRYFLGRKIQMKLRPLP